MTRLTRFFIASLAIPSALLAAGGCRSPQEPGTPGPPGFHNNRTCSIKNDAWSTVPKGAWVGNPTGADAFIAAMTSAGCSTPRDYRPCADPAKCTEWPMTTCPMASLATISAAASHDSPVLSFDGIWDKCTGAPDAGSTGITWRPGPQSPAGGCHTAGCGE